MWLFREKIMTPEETLLLKNKILAKSQNQQQQNFINEQNKPKITVITSQKQGCGCSRKR